MMDLARHVLAVEFPPQLAALLVHQHQRRLLRADDAENGVQDALQHLVGGEQGGDGFAHLVQRVQFLQPAAQLPVGCGQPPVEDVCLPAQAGLGQPALDRALQLLGG